MTEQQPTAPGALDASDAAVDNASSGAPGLDAAAAAVALPGSADFSSADFSSADLDSANSNNANPNGAESAGNQPGISLRVEQLNLYYGTSQALRGINLDIPRREVTSFIGPSGCGKSTLLRCFNRMNDLIDGVRLEGRILLEGLDINRPGINVSQLRRRVGMVFQRPNPFPKSVYENVAYGLRLDDKVHQAEMDDRVEWALRSAALWDEVKDRLQDSALGLSGGQQQRLVIARAIAIEPSVLLLDEPASALDPISTLKIEELIQQLKKQYTIVIVTHNMQQAARVSDNTAFLYLGELIEFGDTNSVFTNPQHQQTEDYITGRYG